MNSTDTWKLLLVKSAYSYDPDHDFVNDVSASECDASGYVGGHSGADRLTTTFTTTEQTSANRVVGIFQDRTWSAIGGASNNTLSGSLLFWENTADSDSIPLAWLEWSSTLVTNGSDILQSVDSTNGNLRFTV